MGFVIGAAAAAAVAFIPQASAQQSPTGAAPDRLVAQILPAGRQDPRRLAELFAGEPRDTVWAGGTEAALRALYAPLAGRGQIVLQRIACARTICEVVGTIPPGGGAQVSAAMRTLRDPRRNVLPPAAGAYFVGVAVHQQDFAVFWSRRE